VKRAQKAGSLVERSPHLLRSHWLFAVLLLAGIIVRSLAIIGERPALLYNGDSFFYLENSRSLAPDSFHPVVYALLLWCLHSTGSLLSVSILQHALGILAGIFVYVLCIRQGVRPWLAAIAAAPILLDLYEVVVEQMVIADSLAVVLLAFSLLLATGRSRAACALAGIAFAFAALTRLVLLAAFPALLLIAWGTGSGKPRRLRVPVLLASLVVPLVAYASWMQAVTGEFGLERASGMLLYGRLASVADCRSLHLTEQEKPLCESAPYHLSPLFYMWSAHSPLRQHFSSPHGQPWFVSSVTFGFAERVILTQPGEYFPSVASEFVDYFSPLRDSQDRGMPAVIYLFPVVTTHVYNVVPANVGFPVGAAGPRLAQAQVTIVRPVASLLRRLQRFLYTPGPVLAVALLVALWSFLATVKRRDKLHMIGVRALGLALGGVSLLVGTAATGVFDWRFLLPALVIIPPAGAIGAETLLRWHRAFASSESG